MGKEQLEIKDICDSLGIRLIAYSPLGLGMLTGKYSPAKLPSGPRCVCSFFNFETAIMINSYNSCIISIVIVKNFVIISFCRALLFGQILPGLEPLLNSLREIARKRRKTLAQVISFSLVIFIVTLSDRYLSFCNCIMQ